MAKMDLFIKYTVKGKREKKMKLSTNGKPFIFGRSSQAQVVLGGEDISPLHTAIENREGKWVLMDLSSDSGTWINNEVIEEEVISNATEFRIGQHTIKLELRPAHDSLYMGSLEDGKGNDLHEVIVKSKKGVLDAVLLAGNESYTRVIKGKEFTFKPPVTTNWQKTEVNGYEILQRMVKKPDQLKGVGETQAGFDIRSPYMFVPGILALLILVVALFPKAPVEEEQKKPEMNTYTRLIYDKNLIKEKRKQALSITKQKFKENEKTAAAPANNPSTETRKQAQAAPKVITKIKASGIQQLLGKIATRKNLTNKNMIIASGSTEYEKARGVAGSSGTAVSVSGVSGGVKGGSAKGVQVAAIGTKGIGGGGSVSNLGSLKSGGIGSADVGLVEEEAEVGGGLDKDAVAAVIRSNIGQIRYCYERKLTANPNLYGKVLVQFSIEGQGAVFRPKVSRTTLQDTDVEGCILRRLSQWKFPTPSAGSSVLVTYPFLFKSTQ